MQPLLLLCVALVLRLAASAGAGPGGCSAAIREVRASLLAKVSALQKNLQDSLVLIKSELRAVREANEAGLLDLKSAVAARSGARDMPLVPVKNDPVLREVADSVRQQVARIRPILSAAHQQLRTDLRSELRRLRAEVGAAKPVRAICAPSEQLLRRLGTATCAAAAKALTGGLAGLARASGRLQARAQSLLSQQLGQQRRQLVAFERRQNATLRRVERALNCSKAPGSSTTETAKTGPAKSNQSFQLVNVALGKKTNQSSIGWRGQSSHAVDGNTNGYYRLSSCTSAFNRGRTWWTVDLGRAYPVHSVVLWNRVDCCAKQLRGFKVWLSTKSGYISSAAKSSQTQCSGQVGLWSDANPKITVSCGNKVARYVTVSKNNGRDLNLCEVQVQVGWSAELFKTKPKPQLVNVALGKKTNQSSTARKGNSSRAVDGNTNGNAYSKSCSHTNNRGRIWWTVDLGRAYPVHSVVLWNRVDCCGSQLRGFKVWLSIKSGYVSSASKSSQTQCSGQVGRWSSFNPKITVSCGNQTARYVTVSKKYGRTLTLCEVEVQVERNAVPATNKQSLQLVNVARGKKTRQSSTGGRSISSRAVDGNTNGYFYSRSCTHTNNRGRTWWTVDLGRAYPVHSVVLWNRVDCCAHRLRGFKVWLSTKSGYVSSAAKSSQAQCSGQVGRWSSVNPKIIVSCGNQTARYVTVSKTNDMQLTLCEVEVQVLKRAELAADKQSLQLVNLARGKKTRHSSTGWRGSPSRAVDGNTNGYYSSRSCSHTNNRGRTWWTVDLGRAYPVHSVVLWNRVGCCANRLRGFEVWLSTKSGYVSSAAKSSQTQCSGQVGRWSSVNPKITVSCGNQTARYVTVSKTNGLALTLCEVEVQVARSAAGSRALF